MGSHFSSTVESVRVSEMSAIQPQKAESTSTLNSRGGTRRPLKTWNLLWVCYCFITSRQWLSLFRCLVITVVLDIVLCHKVHIDSGAHKTSYPMGRGSLSAGNSDRCVKFTTHLHLVPRLRVREALLVPATWLFYDVMLKNTDRFTFYHFRFWIISSAEMEFLITHGSLHW
jgi:hypothetical protein